MRWIGRSLVAALLLAWVALYAYPGAISLWKKSQSAGSDLAKARASTFFPLDNDNWLVFDIPKNSGLFRVYSHAALTNDSADATARYTVEYQWLDANGEILEDGQHHITTRAANTLPELDLVSAETTHRSLRFYKHQRNRPSRDHALYFNAKKNPEAQALRFRIGEKDNTVELIGIRPYQQHDRANQDVDLAWQRMSVEQRENLSRGSLYPSFLLSDFERRNVLSTYWKPIGPLGVLDRDYRIDTLYQLDAEVPVLPPETPGSDGLFASPIHWVTVFLPEDTALYRIEWQALPEVSLPESISFHWQGMDSSERDEWQGLVKDKAWEGKLERGLLQLVPNQAGLMKLFVWRNGQKLDITPQKRYTRTFECLPGTPLNYALSPGSDPQPLRVDARTFSRMDRPLAAGDSTIELNVLDAQNRLLYSRQSRLSEESYPYQQFSDAAWVPSSVNEPRTTYLRANVDAATLQIHCDAPSLLSLYTRPWHKPVTRKLPEQDNIWLSFEDREPAWFTVQPENADALVRQKRYQTLLWYFKPFGLEGIFADDSHQRIELHPTNPDAFESYFFSSHPKKGLPRLDVLGSAYLKLNNDLNMPMAGRNRERDLSPNLVYLRNSAAPQSIQVLVDDKLIVEKTVVGKSGRFKLPGVSAGSHRIAVKSEQIDWFISNSTLPDQTHLLRSAYGISGGSDGDYSLEYRLPLENLPASLSFWLYADKSNIDLECRLELLAERNDEVEDSFTLRRYRYVVDSDNFEKSYLLQASQPDISGPIKLSVSLDHDLRGRGAKARLSCNRGKMFVSAGLLLDGSPSHRHFKERYDHN